MTTTRNLSPRRRRPGQLGERLAPERGESGERLSAEQQRTALDHARPHGRHHLSGDRVQRAVRRLGLGGQARVGLGPDRRQRRVHVQRKSRNAFAASRWSTTLGRDCYYFFFFFIKSIHT